MKRYQRILMFLILLSQSAFSQGDGSTYFTDGAGTFTNSGDWETQGFTISQRTTFVMRVAADYKIQYAIIVGSQLNAFKNNQAFSGYGTFNGTYGYHTVTLAAGTYYAAIRSMVASPNQYRWELDYPRKWTGYYVAANGIHAVDHVSPNGGTLYHSFTVTSGYRYWIDGCNSGLVTDVIPASALSNYLNRKTFSHYATYSGSGTDLPGGYQLKLAPGKYYLCFRNNAGIAKTVNYVMQIYRHN